MPRDQLLRASTKSLNRCVPAKRIRKRPLYPMHYRAPANLKTSPKDITRKLVCVRVAAASSFAFYYYLLLNNRVDFIACKHLFPNNSDIYFYHIRRSTGIVTEIVFVSVKHLEMFANVKTKAPLYFFFTLIKFRNKCLKNYLGTI